MTPTSSLKTIGLVFGGDSDEHNVSINSAKTIFNALRRGSNAQRFQIVCIYIDQKGRWWTNSFAEEILKGAKNISNQNPQSSSLPKGLNLSIQGAEDIDVWFPVLHGPNGEDGTIQGLFTLTKKPFVGAGVLGSALGMDKVSMKKIFAEAGLPQIQFCSANRAQITNKRESILLIKKIEEELGYPCFIKPSRLGSSIGITKAYSRDQLVRGLKLSTKLDEKIVIEKSVCARELECGVLGREAIKTSVVGEITFQSDWYDFETKYSGGLSKMIIPAKIPTEISKKIQEMSLLACKALSVEGIARVDFFYDENQNKLWINEINTFPGFTEQSMYPQLWEASGLNLEDLVAELIKTAK